MITIRLLTNLLEKIMTETGMLVSMIIACFCVFLIIMTSPMMNTSVTEVHAKPVNGISPHTQWKSSVVPREKACEEKECGGYEIEKGENL
jgi:hypothetical protein